MRSEDMGPLMRLEHGEEERRVLASDLAPHLQAWVQDSPLLHLEVKENLFQEKEEEEDKGEEVKRLETKLRLLAVHSRLLSTLMASFPEKEVGLYSSPPFLLFKQFPLLPRLNKSAFSFPPSPTMPLTSS